MKLQTADGKPEESYITTYFPATPDLTQAAGIDVPAGADLAGLDLQLQRAHAVRVRGRVSGLEVAPFPFVVITLQTVGSQSGTVRDALVRDPSGEFELHGVPPGKYVLSANAPDLTNRGSGPSTERAIEVGQTDLEGIQLTLAAPQAVSGVVIAAEGRKIPQNPAGATGDALEPSEDEWAGGRVGPGRFRWSVQLRVGRRRRI